MFPYQHLTDAELLLELGRASIINQGLAAPATYHIHSARAPSPVPQIRIVEASDDEYPPSSESDSDSDDESESDSDSDSDTNSGSAMKDASFAHTLASLDAIIVKLHAVLEGMTPGDEKDRAVRHTLQYIDAVTQAVRIHRELRYLENGFELESGVLSKNEANKSALEEDTVQ